MTTTHDIGSIAREYLKTLEQRVDAQELLPFLHPDVRQTEYPNRLTPAGATRNLEDLLTASERGRQVLVREFYEILNELVSGTTVALEIRWTGVLAVPVGSLQPGDSLKLHFATFIEFREGKIWRQRNYDCFEPF